MRNFFDLVKFEYKKIFMRKSAVIALLIVIGIVCAVPISWFFGTDYRWGEDLTLYQAMVKDREYNLSVSALPGRLIDETLIVETIEAYSHVPDMERLWDTPEYVQYARPYDEIYRILYTVYGSHDKILSLTDEDISNFYQYYRDYVVQTIRAEEISEAAKDKLIRLFDEIETPLTFEYTDWVVNIFHYATAVFCALALAVCLAPLFSNEYSTRTDQLILSSKLGKTKLISAKLFAALSLCTMYFIFLHVISFMLNASIHGIGGVSDSLRMYLPFCTYPFTLLEIIAIHLICSFFGMILIAALTLFLSSLFKSPFGVIIIATLLLFVPMMVKVPQTLWLYRLFTLLPTSMMSLSFSVFSNRPIEAFGVIILPYIYPSLFAVIAGTIMLFFARMAFRNHQIR